MRIGSVSCLNLRVISSDTPLSLFIIEPTSNKATRNFHTLLLLSVHSVFVLLSHILFFLNLLSALFLVLYHVISVMLLTRLSYSYML
jgi:hypothetical protein